MNLHEFIESLEDGSFYTVAEKVAKLEPKYFTIACCYITLNASTESANQFLRVLSEVLNKD